MKHWVLWLILKAATIRNWKGELFFDTCLSDCFYTTCLDRSPFLLENT